MQSENLKNIFERALEIDEVHVVYDREQRKYTVTMMCVGESPVVKTFSRDGIEKTIKMIRRLDNVGALDVLAKKQ